MSTQDELLDTQIRAALLRTPVGEADFASALPRVRARARTRRNRHRTAGVLGSTVIAALIAVSLTNETDHVGVVTDSPPQSATSTSKPPDYGFAPLTPLVDEPLPVIPRTDLLVVDGHTLAVESTPESLILSLTNGVGGAGSLSGDPRASPALVIGGVTPASNDPAPTSYLYGVTRAEVARVDWVRKSGTVTVQTIAHEAFPQLRFFIIEDPEQVMTRPISSDGITEVFEAPFVIAYAADGALLTDSQRVIAESADLARELDRRRGLEDKPARVLNAQGSADSQMLTITVFNCGDENPAPRWTIGESAVRVSVSVKVPLGAGDCLSGETIEINLGLDEPLGARTIVDDRTGKSIPLLTDNERQR